MPGGLTAQGRFVVCMHAKAVCVILVLGYRCHTGAMTPTGSGPITIRLPTPSQCGDEGGDTGEVRAGPAYTTTMTGVVPMYWAVLSNVKVCLVSTYRYHMGIVSRIQ